MVFRSRSLTNMHLHEPIVTEGSRSVQLPTRTLHLESLQGERVPKSVDLTQSQPTVQSVSAPAQAPEVELGQLRVQIDEPTPTPIIITSVHSPNEAAVPDPILRKLESLDLASAPAPTAAPALDLLAPPASAASAASAEPPLSLAPSTSSLHSAHAEPSVVTFHKPDSSALPASSSSQPLPLPSPASMTSAGAIAVGNTAFGGSGSAPAAAFPPVLRVDRQMKDVRIATVPKHHHLMPTLTVRETLSFSAALRRPENDDGSQAVDWVLELLRIAHLADRTVGAEGAGMPAAASQR